MDSIIGISSKTRVNDGASEASAASRLLLIDAKEPVESAHAKKPAVAELKSRDIDISEADTFGWWQKKQYSELGIQKIHLLPAGVALDLKAATQKYNTLGLGTRVSFDFENKGNSWTLTNVVGMTLKGTPITRIESSATKIIFYTGNKSNEYGSSINNYIKALFDPLMRADLRK